jgi:ABC-type uncharacterized transport system permease subunit
VAIIAIIAFWIAFVLYGVGACLSVYQFLLRRQQLEIYARVCVILGFVAQTTFIGVTSRLTSGTILSGPTVVTLASWVAILVYLIFTLVFRVKAYGAFLPPVAIILMGIGRILTGLHMPWAENSAYYTTPLVLFHIIVLLIAFATFLIAGISAGLLMYQNRLLKKHKNIIASKKLPSLSSLKKLSRQPILFGFPFLTVGMLIGIVMTMGGTYSPWFFAPRIILVIVLWALYAVYLFQVYRSGVSMKTSSAMAISGGVLTIVLLVVMGLAPMFM